MRTFTCGIILVLVDYLEYLTNVSPKLAMEWWQQFLLLLIMVVGFLLAVGQDVKELNEKD